MQEVAGIVVADSAVDLILDFIELLGQRIKAGEGGIQRIGTGKAGPGAGRGHEGTHIFKSLLLQCGVCLFRKVGGQVKACKQGSAPITAKYRWFLRAISTVSSIHVKDTGPPAPSRLPISHQAFQV